MIYKIDCNYTIDDNTNIYFTMPIEQLQLEVEIIKSSVSNNCFISIKEDGDYIVEGKICTEGEYIYTRCDRRHRSKLSGDFFFAYTAIEDIGNDFDINKLGKTLFFFYNDAKEE